MDNPRLSKFPQVYTVDASAGSGKTYALAKRYIQFLTGPGIKRGQIPINAILAITFTNKASLEMKERILEFIKEAALDKKSDNKARENARLVMEHILRNYNFFQVQTIDSFINSILYGCAFKLRLSAGFKTKDTYSDFLAYSLDMLIDKADSDKEVLTLFKNFLRQYIYIENKASWFPKQSMLLKINSLFSKTNKYSALFFPNAIDPKDIFALKKDLLKLINELNKKLPAQTNASFVKSLSSFLDANKESFYIDDIPAYFKNDSPPVNKGAVTPDDVKKLWQAIKKGLKNLSELESSSAYNSYIDIFNRVLTELKELSSKEDVLFLEALNKEARALFDEKSIDLPELYYRLATRFKHFLMDEFQDTSRLQWANILPMVEEALSTDGSLFYVGDRKQAIYRFRAGDAALMDEVKDHFKASNLIEESLTKNYRSQKTIVEFNNRIFSKENLEALLKHINESKNSLVEFNDQDKKDILKTFNNAEQTFREEKKFGFVKAQCIDCGTRVERDQALKPLLLETIKDLRTRFALCDIAMLTRTNDQVQLLTSWLIEENIPVESEKTLNIRENPYIKEIMSLLKFLNSPIDNVSFASFLLGDIFSISSGLKQQEARDFIFNCRAKAATGQVYLYKEFRGQYPEIWEEFFKDFFKNVGFVPLYELLISIFRRFEIIKKFSEYQGFFMKLLEVVKTEEEENNSISDFVEFFETAPDEKLYVTASESDSVKILTTHKAKGLEFGAVIVPFFQMSPEVDSEIAIRTGEGLNLIRMKKKYAEFSENLEQVYKQEYIKSLIDELNNIYVALTRASDELHIFVPSKVKNSNNLAAFLLPEKNLEMGRKGRIQKEKKSTVVLNMPASEYKDWISMLKDEFGDESVLRLRQSVQRGKILHYMLSFIGNIHGVDKNALIKGAVIKAKNEYPFISDFTEFEKRISRLLDDKNLKQYFSSPTDTVYLEKEVVNSFGDTKRIDRLIVRPKEVVIIDYKSSREKERQGDYSRQVAEYIRIIKEIYPKHKVTGALLYLDDLSVEEV